MEPEDRFIGRGWGFPPSYVKSGTSIMPRGEVAMTGGIEDIRQSLGIILGTTLGERIMRPDFGCSLEDQVFDAMNASMEVAVDLLSASVVALCHARPLQYDFAHHALGAHLSGKRMGDFYAMLRRCGAAAD